MGEQLLNYAHDVGPSDLGVATGLNRSSLYNSFGSKDVLFAMALNHYTKSLASKVFSSLESGSAGMADINVFLKKFTKHLKTQAGRGCFMVNTMATTPSSVSNDSDLVKTYIALQKYEQVHALGYVKPEPSIRSLS